MKMQPDESFLVPLYVPHFTARSPPLWVYSQAVPSPSASRLSSSRASTVTGPERSEQFTSSTPLCSLLSPPLEPSGRLALGDSVALAVCDALALWDASAHAGVLARASACSSFWS